MSPDTAFAAAGSLAMLGWLLLIAGLLLQGLQRHVGNEAPLLTPLPAPTRAVGTAAGHALWLGGRLVPLLLAAGYAVAIASWWRGAPGGFGSLDDVALLFQRRGLLLAGWVHYLAFDLWLGRWQIDALASAPRLSAAADWGFRLAVMPCLLLTFLFGPIGLLLFIALRAARRGFAAARPVAVSSAGTSG